MSDEKPPVMDKWKCLRCGDEFDFPRGMQQPSICNNPNCEKKGPFAALTGPFTFFDKGKFVPKRLADEIMGKRRFATHAQSHVIWVYGNGSYESDGDNIVREDVREALGDLATENRVNEVVAHVRETTFADPEKFEAPVNLINVKNGILDIFTRKLKSHSPEIIFTNELPVEYNEHVGCPTIMRFLSEVLPAEDIPVIQEAVGYCLYRKYDLAKAFMFLGDGANGKSTLLRLIIAMLGEKNIAAPALQDLIYDRFAKAQLYGKLANIHADLPPTRLAHTGIFKMLTGQDRIYGQKKHQDPFDFYNYAKLLYSANELPGTNDMSEAFWRRWIVIKCPNHFPIGDPKTDTKILDKLTTPNELSGFLNWALAGLKRLLQQGHFTETKTREEIEDEWTMRTDNLRAFVKKHTVADSDYYIQKDVFYEQYIHFCDYYDLTPSEKALVGRRLPTICPNILDTRLVFEGKQVRCWKGIALLMLQKTQIHEKKSYGLIRDSNNGNIVIRNNLSDLCLFESEGTSEQLEQPLGIAARLWEAFGMTPFTQTQWAALFSEEMWGRVVAVLDHFRERGVLIEAPSDGTKIAWEFVRRPVSDEEAEK